jgi:hypothetical protein
MSGGSAHPRWLLTGVVSTRLERFPDKNAAHTVVRKPVTCNLSGLAITAVLIRKRSWFSPASTLVAFAPIPRPREGHIEGQLPGYLSRGWLRTCTCIRDRC